MSTVAFEFARGPARLSRLVLRAAAWELRKVAAFRAGFWLKEVFRNLARPLVMVCVLMSASGLPQGVAGDGVSLQHAVAYMVVVALLEKLVFHDRCLDLSDQIFQGYVTKYFTMPFPYFVLPAGRFVQHIVLQAAIVVPAWTVLSLVVPAWCPPPADWSSAAMALCLVLLGSACFLLFYFTLHALAFWLDVVWTTLVMARMIALFCGGMVLPPMFLPERVQAAFAWTFPWWTVAVPVQLAAGSSEARADFGRGLATLACWLAALSILAALVWARGRRRYAGSGM